MQLFERSEQPLETVSQLDGRGGVGEHGGRDDEQHQSQHHEYRHADALYADMQEFPLPDIITRRIEQIEHRREHDDEQNGLETAHDHFGGNTRNSDNEGEKQDDKAIRDRSLRKKQQHNECNRQHDLDARVKPVNGAVSGEELADGNVLEHQ